MLLRKATLALTAIAIVVAQPPQAAGQTYELNDSHFHLTNYVQEGTTSTTS